MTTYTNYDQSSCGLNMELSVFRDTDRSQRDFEESFNVLRYSGYRQNTIAVYTEFDNVSGDFSFSDFSMYKFSKKELQDAFKKQFDHELSQHFFSKPFSKLTKSELIEFVENSAYGSDEIAEFLKDNFTPLFDTIITRGYSQGDYADVIITPAMKAYLLSNGADYDNDQKVRNQISNIIDRLFWNAPVYARLEIDGDEYYLDELLTDQYEYDKDDMIAKFKEAYSSMDNLDLVVDFLESNLPDYPEYN